MADQPWIFHFAYLRGLDGKLPNTQSSKEVRGDREGDSTQINPQEKSTQSSEADKRERADGQSQFDYLRRLSDDIKSRDEELWRTKQGKIAAIGVLGSDVYDKLLILQALRPNFPEAVFFTTDLDARFLPQEKLSQTQNLLVASSYGLKLRNALQGGVPPFRSAYQTSIFLATGLAIHDAWSEAGENDALAHKIHDLVDSPRLFQIGRTGAYPLPTAPRDPSHEATDTEQDRDSTACASDINNCQYIQPPARKLFPEPESSFWLALLLIAVTALFGAIASSRRVYRFIFRQPLATATELPQIQRDQGLAFGLCIAVLTVLYTLRVVGAAKLPDNWWLKIPDFTAYLNHAWHSFADWLTESASGEPMVWFEGISVWPTIVLRFISLVLGAFLIYRTLKILEKNAAATAIEMRLEGFRHPTFGRRAAKRRPCPNLRSILYMFSLSPAGQRLPAAASQRLDYDVLKFWRLYGYNSTSTARLLRALVVTVGIFLLSIILLIIFGHALLSTVGSPTTSLPRGERIRSIYQFVTLLSFFITILLTFLVVDATLLARSFVRELRLVQSRWPSATIGYFSDRLGLEGKDLGDWLDIQVLAQRTADITNLVYFPFVVIAVGIISNNPLFGKLSTTPMGLILLGISLSAIFVSALLLRSAAERARATAAAHLTEKLISAKGAKNEAIAGHDREAIAGENKEAAEGENKTAAGEKNDAAAEEKNGSRAQQLEILLDRVNNLQEGAFAPWPSQPLVRAVLLPLLT